MQQIKINFIQIFRFFENKEEYLECSKNRKIKTIFSITRISKKGESSLEYICEVYKIYVYICIWHVSNKENKIFDKSTQELNTKC